MNILFALFALLLPVHSFAQVFKCVNSGAVSYSAIPCSSGAAPYNSSRISGAVSSSNGVITVHRSAEGVYPLQVNLNGINVSMLVDTGATYTTVSSRIGSELGVHSCEATGISNTANGQTSFCSITVSSLSVGALRFSNVPVKIQAGLSMDGLLGNDFLSHFKIEHQNGVMRLSR